VDVARKQTDKLSIVLLWGRGRVQPQECCV
jgi:hypothetical protein